MFADHVRIPRQVFDNQERSVWQYNDNTVLPSFLDCLLAAREPLAAFAFERLLFGGGGGGASSTGGGASFSNAGSDASPDSL